MWWVLEVSISVRTDITGGPQGRREPDYLIVAPQRLTRNAMMHRVTLRPAP